MRVTLKELWTLMLLLVRDLHAGPTHQVFFYLFRLVCRAQYVSVWHSWCVFETPCEEDSFYLLVFRHTRGRRGRTLTVGKG